MQAAIFRIVRVLLAQGITWGLAKWGNINLPIIEITVGALINGAFKYIREKYPKSKILNYLPL